MKKKLIVINGTMGVGKSALCNALYKTIDHSAWLDGDWCWMINPFQVTQEDKKTIIENISNMLNSYICNQNIHTIIFSWVIPEKEILEWILEKISSEYELGWATLIADKSEIADRISKRKKIELRDDYEIERSFEYMKRYFTDMDSVKIDTTDKSIEELVGIVKEEFSI